MKKKITVIKGDGIGPETIDQALKVLNCISDIYSHSFEYDYALLGGECIEKTGVPITEDTITKAKSSDAVLLGSVGGPKWDSLPANLRPEKGLLTIRKELNLFANLRPALLFPALASACPLKPEIVNDGFDVLVVRELTGGLYFGEHKTIVQNGMKKAIDSLEYSEEEIKRIAIKGFEIARKRKRKVTSVDKANVLDSSRLWRDVVHETAKAYPDVELEDILIDNCTMQLLKCPCRFDVILTENMFGDILSDEASMLTGSIGMLASASINETSLGLYEPSHGSAPDIAGQNIANPIATILSAAMMLRYSLNMQKEADAIESAVRLVIDNLYRTVDIITDGCKKVTCSEMGDKIIEALKI